MSFRCQGQTGPCLSKESPLFTFKSQAPGAYISIEDKTTELTHILTGRCLHTHTLSGSISLTQVSSFMLSHAVQGKAKLGSPNQHWSVQYQNLITNKKQTITWEIRQKTGKKTRKAEECTGSVPVPNVQCAGILEYLQQICTCRQCMCVGVCVCESLSTTKSDW